METVPKTRKKNIPKNIREMSQDTLLEVLKKKKECNAKALQIVEKLCETCIEEEWFLTNLQFINQCHFDDATVERAITKVCGYPLCDQKLGKIPTQQYHISTKYNKVFDITERKNFCSSWCFKCAMHIKKQLFTSPLWFRDQEVIPRYTVLKSKSSLGEEIVYLPDKSNLLPEDSSKTTSSEKIDNVDSSINKLAEEYSNLSVNDCKSDEDRIKLSQDECTFNVKKENVFSHIANKEEKEGRQESHTHTSKEEKAFESSKNENLNNLKKSKIKDDSVDVIKKVEKCIFEWFSIDSLFYLYGEKKLQELFKDKANIIKEILNSKLSLAGPNEKINKMIQLYGLMDTEVFMNSEVKTNLKPLPDYSVLKEEGKTLEIKVRAFYGGQLQVNEAKKEGKNKENEGKESDSDSTPIYLPLVDAHAQNALRRTIVLDKLNKVLPELMKAFSVDYMLQMLEVRNLVSTFTLSATNITFKPGEWYLIGIILIKLLSLKNKKLESILNLESSQSQILRILMSYEVQEDYLNELVCKLTDSTTLMKKLNDINL